MMNMAPCDSVITGNIVTPEGVFPNGWVAISGHTIAATGTGEPPVSRTRRDFGNAHILPGAVDGQVHACSSAGLDGLAATTQAAAAGGITTIVDMPYDHPEPVWSLDALHRKIEAIETLAHVDVALYATVPKDDCDAIIDLVEAGCCAVKISHFESHPTRFPRIGMNQTLDLLEILAPTDIPVGLHNEDQEIVLSRMARLKAAGHDSADWHAISRPIAAELASTAAFLELGAVTGAHVHIVHFSTPRGYDLVANYRAQGHRSTAEICAHYLHFDPAEDMPRLGNLLKVNPPLRPGLREGLWDSYRNGHIAFVSSDHGSWPLARKQTPSVFDAGAGIPGLQTLVPGFLTDLIQRFDDPFVRAARDLCENPARFFGLWPRKGALVAGADADLMVLGSEPMTFDATKTFDGLNWSPYDGEQFATRVLATLVGGRQVFDGTAITGQPGAGRFIPRS